MGSQKFKNGLQVAFRLICVLGFVYLFLVSIGLMGAAFKGFGKEFAENLIRTTSNPFVALVIGVLATSLVQSSSTTTSIVVGMVGSGVLTVNNAIPIIMGANIGTAVTNTMVALGHVSRREEFKRAVTGATVHDFFNLVCVCIMFPLEMAFGFLQKASLAISGFFIGVDAQTFNSPVKAATKPVITFVKHFFKDTLALDGKVAYIMMLILALVIIFVALYFIVKIMKSLVMHKAESVFDNVLGRHGLIAFAAGLIFTVIVQSSSITTSLMVPMVAAGLLQLEVLFPIVLGANIGTTITAMLASLALGNISAISIAIVHLLFNVAGALFISQVPIFRKIPLSLARNLGEIAYKKRRYAFIYVFCLYFVIPGLLIAISKLIG